MADYQGVAGLAQTDPEFAERFAYFAGEEVPEAAAELLPRERYLVVLAALLGCQGLDEFRLMAAEALDAGVTPVELKEVVYQACAYLGIGRVRPFLDAANELLAARGVGLPLEPQATTTLETRCAAGNQKQVDYFGEGMRESWESGPAERAHVNRWLAENCFGDLGRTKDFLYRVVSQMLPYIGYPRSLNALSCIDNAAAARA